MEIPAAYQPLVERLRAGKVVLCSGSGLGKDAGRPTWRDLIGRLLERLEASAEVSEAQALLDTHPLTASGYVRRSLGQGFRQALREAIPANGVLPELARLIGQLPFRAALTTAYDDLLERSFHEAGKSPPVFTADEAESVRREGRGRFILRLFGDPRSDAKEVVFGSADLHRVLADESLRQLMGELYHKRSLLFLGFDPGDPDFEILLDRVLLGTRPLGGGHEPQHFAVMPGLPRIARWELESSLGIRVLPDEDALSVLRLLRDAIGEHEGEIVPDDDDMEGWLRVLSQEPERADALAKLDALEARLAADGETDRLIELYLGRVEIEADPRQRSACLCRIAEMLEHQKGQMAEAFHTLLEAYREAPQAALLDELERLCGKTGQWVELLSALRELIHQIPMEQRADAWVRVARLYGDKLNHTEYALTSLAEAQKLEVSDAGTRQQLVELRVDLSRRAERWKELAEALGVLAEDVPERERKVDLLLEQGDIFESRLSNGPAAKAAFRRALEVDPGSRDALTALEHLLRRHRDWPELILALDRKAELLLAGGDHAGWNQAKREAATIATDHLTDRKAAIERWEELRKADANDLDALRALERLLAQEGSYSERYLSVLSSLAAVVSSDKERLALYRRLSAEYEEMPGHAAQAAAALERILDIDPSAEDAYRGLERLYRLDKKWVLLVDTYKRHARHAKSGRAEIHAAIGKIYETEIPEGDPDKVLLAAPQAVEAWAEVLRLEPESLAAMDALIRLYQLTESWEDAIRVLDKRANLTDEKALKVALRHQAGRITLDRLRDYKAAEERLVLALEVDPQHVPSMAALVELYRKQGEYLRAARLLVEAAEHCQNRLDKTRYLVEAGELYATLDDRKLAAELYLKALAVDPEHVEAGMRAQELLWKEKRYAEMIPILEMLIRKESDHGDLTQRLTRLAQAAQLSGDTERALRAFTRAAEVAPADLTAQRGRMALLMEQERFQEAREAGGQILMHHRDTLSAGEMVDLFHKLGECERHLGRNDLARNFYAKALDIEPSHQPTLEAQLLLGDLLPEQQIEIKRTLLRWAFDDRRVQLLSEIGDLQAEALGQKAEALETYREALALRPDSHVLMHKCLDLCTETRDWQGAVAILDSLIEKEANQKRRARYRLTTALIARDELKDAPRALGLFAAALEDDPTLERAAVDLEKLAVEMGDAREIARAYKRKIKMLSPDFENDTKEQRAERLRLWSDLAQLCIDKLRDGETALAALEVVVALDRFNIEKQRQLAGLYVQAGPDRIDKAIAAHQALLVMNKGELMSYRALKHLYLQARQREKAACVAQALMILRKAEPEDERLVQEVIKGRPLQPARRPMKQELWRVLTHPEEDRQIGALFQAVFPVVQQGNARPFKDAGLNRKERIDAADPHLYAKALRYGVEVLDALVPEAYAQPDQKEHAFIILHCMDKGQAPVICALLGSALLNPKRPEREVMYEIGRLGALLRPRRVLRTLLPTAQQLGLVIDSAMALSGIGPETPSKVAETAQGLRRSLAPQLLEQISAFGKSLREAGVKGEVAAQSWLTWSDLTAVRTGLVLSGDLETVALLLATDPPGTSPLTPKQRLLEILHFSVTEDYFTIRQHLGLMG